MAIELDAGHASLTSQPSAIVDLIDLAVIDLGATNGGNGDDSLYGEAGNDYLDGSDGVDLLDGGPDFDFCVNGETAINCEAP